MHGRRRGENKAISMSEWIRYGVLVEAPEAALLPALKHPLGALESFRKAGQAKPCQSIA